MGRIEDVQDVLQDTFDSLLNYSRDHQGIVLGGTAVALIGSFFIFGSSRQHRHKPGTRELGGGTIKKADIKREYDDYSKAYGKEAGDGIFYIYKST